MKVLARFDWASTREVADAARISVRATWNILGQLVTSGHVEARSKDYRLTPNGRIVARIQRRHAV